MFSTGTGRRTTTTTSTRSTSTTSSGSSGTTSTTSSNKARADQELFEMYHEAFGIKPSRLVLQQMYDWMQETSIDVLQYALMEAACAPSPSWRYALAILRDCQGLHVMAKPGQSLRQAVEIARGMRCYQQSQRRRYLYSDDETRMPYDD